MMAIRSDGVICVLRNFCAADLRADLVLNGHADQVEEHHQQPAVLILHLARLGRRDLGLHERLDRRRKIGGRLGPLLQGGRRFDRRGPASSSSCWNSKTEIFCGLPSSVTVKSRRLEALDGLAVLIFGGDIDDHQLHVGFELVAALGSAECVLGGRVLGSGIRLGALCCAERASSPASKVIRIGRIG